MLVPATTVPVTIIGAFAAMAALGFTVNFSTLFAIVLAIGIVVDDAIVVVEGAAHNIEQGMSGHDAAIRRDGPAVRADRRHHAGADGGVPAGRLPAGPDRPHVRAVRAGDRRDRADERDQCGRRSSRRRARCGCGRRCRPKSATSSTAASTGSTTAAERGYAWLDRPHGGAQRRHGGGRAALIIGLSVYGFSRIPTGFLPIEDQGYLIAIVQLPDGASLARTQQMLDKVQAIAGKTPGVDHVITIAGVSALDNSATLANAGVAYIILKDWGEREKQNGQDLLSLFTSLNQSLSAIEEARIIVMPPPAIQGVGNAAGFTCRSSCATAASTWSSCRAWSTPSSPTPGPSRACSRDGVVPRLGAAIHRRDRPREDARPFSSTSTRCSPRSPAISARATSTSSTSSAASSRSTCRATRSSV